MKLFIPANGQKARILDFRVLVEVITELNFWVIDADDTGYLCVHFSLVIDSKRFTLVIIFRGTALHFAFPFPFAFALSLFVCLLGLRLIINFWLNLSAHEVFQGRAVRKVPNFNLAIGTRSYQPSTPHIKGTRCNLWVILLSQLRVHIRLSLEFWHQLSVLDVPHRNETVVISWYHCIKLVIISGKRNRSLMTSLDFLLGLEGPELDLSWANNDIVGDRVIP